MKKDKMNEKGNETFSPKNGAEIPVKKNIREAILNFFNEALEKKIFDAVLVPVKVPAGNSYSWILIKDKSLLRKANPIAPIMPVQGAKALSSLTRKGKGNIRIAAIMRPCEIRATVELCKLEQINLNNVYLFSFDCPGTLPLPDYIEDPAKGEKIFKSIISENNWNDERIKPVCKMCTNFSIPSCDLHFGILGVEESPIEVEDKNNLLLIPNSTKGKSILKELGDFETGGLGDWEKKVNEIRKKKEKIKTETYKEVKPMVEGLDSLVDTFSNCISCHNCMSACPICYCRQCYFDSEVTKFTPDNFLLRAKKRGGMRFPPDVILFHAGRMSHMISPVFPVECARMSAQFPYL